MTVSTVSERARQVHQGAIVVDTSAALGFHNNRDFVTGREHGEYDLDRATRGGVTAVVLEPGVEEIFVSDPNQGNVAPPPRGVQVMEPVFKGPDMVQRILWEVDALLETIDKNPSTMTLALTAEDVRSAKTEGKFAAIMGIHAGWINSDLSVLKSYRRLGPRAMALCHGATMGWASSSRDLSAPYDGLTDFGREVVAECNRLGVVVDVSHASDQTLWDALETSDAPILASHSGCRALVDAQRNLTDEQMEAIAATDGVVSITAVEGFVDADHSAHGGRNDYMDRILTADRAMARDFPDSFDLMKAIRDPAVKSSYLDVTSTLEIPPTPLSKMIDHIDHAMKVVGPDHVGIGTDFDGVVRTLQDFEEPSKYPNVTAALLDRGYNEEDVRKILGGNFLRLFEAVSG